MGAIYRRKYKKSDGTVMTCKTFTIKYYRNGKPYTESTKCINQKDAKRLLQLREGSIVEGKFHGLAVEQTSFEDLAEGLRTNYMINNRKHPDRAERSIRNLSKVFAGKKASQITSDDITAYILKRKAEDAANATINRELSALKRMFNLALRQTPPKVANAPYITKLDENNVRSGFFERDEYSKLKDVLPEHLKPVFSMGYSTGMRIGEILLLQWKNINMIDRKITLFAGTTKNNESRVIFMTEELYDIISAQKKLRDKDYPTCPYVFFRNGRQIKSFYASWVSCCMATGLEGKLFHDLRRTAIRNMDKAGVSDKTAMKISGHKTDSVYKRYRIVTEEDLEAAAVCLDRFYEKVDEKVKMAEKSDQPSS